MTRDKEIFDAACDYCRKDENAEAVDFVEGAAWADEHPLWLSLKDEVPDEGLDVIVYSRIDGKAVQATYKGYDWERERHLFDSDILGAHCDNVTHWMPMPGAPSEDSLHT